MAKEKKEESLQWYQKLSEEDTSGQKRKKTRKRKRSDSQQKKEISNVDLNRYVETTQQWIDEVSVFMKVPKRKDFSWNTLRAVLHAIRDRLSPEEAFHFSAQLPMLIRGMFFEGYSISEKPEKYNLDELIERIEDALVPAMDLDAEKAFEAVLRVLYDHVSDGQLEDMYRTMPKDIRRLWDESLKSYSV